MTPRPNPFDPAPLIPAPEAKKVVSLSSLPLAVVPGTNTENDHPTGSFLFELNVAMERLGALDTADFPPSPAAITAQPEAFATAAKTDATAQPGPSPWPPLTPKVAAPAAPSKVTATSDWAKLAAPAPAPKSAPPWQLTRAPHARRLMSPLGLTVGAVILISIGAFPLIRTRTPTTTSAAPRRGRLTVDSRPAGAEILVDGQPRGATPLTMSLEPGTHTMTLRRGADERTVPLRLAAGAEVQQYFDFASSSPDVTPTSRISVVTDPPRAQVSVDGRPRGASPLTIEDLSPEDHRVTVTGETGSAERTLTLAGGGTTSIVFSLPQVSSPLAGWLRVSTPFESQIFQNNEMLGTSATSKIMLPAGRQKITLVSQTLGYRESLETEVVPGKVTTVRVESPKVPLSANARPWADVSVDGKAVGQTPVANVELAIGTHEVVFRHPQLGERRQTVVLTVKGPNRISMDLTK